MSEHAALILINTTAAAAAKLDWAVRTRTAAKTSAKNRMNYNYYQRMQVIIVAFLAKNIHNGYTDVALNNAQTPSLPSISGIANASLLQSH